MGKTSHYLKEAFVPTPEGAVYSSLLRPRSPRPDALTVVIMHGAGQASSARHGGFATQWADAGVAVLSLDFLGHGQTGGKVANNSLALRTSHAAAVINHWIPDSTPIMLCGFSMSGHTVLRLLGAVSHPIHSIGLFCPATYASAAEEVTFGPTFTDIIRTPDAWRSSLALEAAGAYAGRALVVVGSEDTVIPWEVISETIQALKQNGEAVRLEVLGGVEHKLAGWISEHPALGQQLASYLIGTAKS